MAKRLITELNRFHRNESARASLNDALDWLERMEALGWELYMLETKQHTINGHKTTIWVQKDVEVDIVE